jgi:exodeoxyribonuclease VII small subunit
LSPVGEERERTMVERDQGIDVTGDVLREHLEHLSFEAAFTELERVVQQLEEGELSLEASIALYEKGQVLAQFCQDRLDQAELRVEQISSERLESGSVTGGALC